MKNTKTKFFYQDDECWLIDREVCNCESCGDVVAIFILKTTEIKKVKKSELIEK
jgi:hypothetical protein